MYFFSTKPHVLPTNYFVCFSNLIMFVMPWICTSKSFKPYFSYFRKVFFITWFNDWIYIYTKNYNTTFRYNKKKISKHLKLLKFFKFKINLEASWFFINDMVGKMSLLYPLRRRMPSCFYTKLKNNSYALSFCRSYFFTVSVNVWSLLCFLFCSIFFTSENFEYVLLPRLKLLSVFTT